MINIIKNIKIAEPPYEYDFLLNLDEKEYSKYLAKIYEVRTDKKLPLCFDWQTRAWVIDKNKCKTFNEKIQWLKLYGVTDLMRKCTDKFTVRDYVKEKIGEEYLKPVLQVCNSFDEIDFDKLPNSFVIKCNHGCKWQFIVKKKKELLQNRHLFNNVKRQMTGWLEQEFWAFEGFELQYSGLKHKIIIEPYMKEENQSIEISVYCFNSLPKIIAYAKCNNDEKELYYFDENFNNIDIIFSLEGKNYVKKGEIGEISNIVKQAIDLSKILSQDFKFVRVDFMVYQNKLYFLELTFTPFSGFTQLNEKWNKKMGEFFNA